MWICGSIEIRRSVSVCVYIYIYIANEKVCSFSNKKRIRGQYKKISSLCMCMRTYIYIHIFHQKDGKTLNVKVYVDGKIKKKLKDINRGVDRKKG